MSNRVCYPHGANNCPIHAAQQVANRAGEASWQRQQEVNRKLDRIIELLEMLACPASSCAPDDSAALASGGET